MPRSVFPSTPMLSRTPRAKRLGRGFPRAQRAARRPGQGGRRAAGAQSSLLPNKKAHSSIRPVRRRGFQGAAGSLRLKPMRKKMCGLAMQTMLGLWNSQFPSPGPETDEDPEPLAKYTSFAWRDASPRPTRSSTACETQRLWLVCRRLHDYNHQEHTRGLFTPCVLEPSFRIKERT